MKELSNCNRRNVGMHRERLFLFCFALNINLMNLSIILVHFHTVCLNHFMIIFSAILLLDINEVMLLHLFLYSLETQGKLKWILFCFVLVTLIQNLMCVWRGNLNWEFYRITLACRQFCLEFYLFPINVGGHSPQWTMPVLIRWA